MQQESHFSRLDPNDYGLDLSLPSDQVAEMRLLASILVDPDEALNHGLEEVTEEMFTKGLYIRTWRAIKLAIDMKEQIEVSAIVSRLPPLYCGDGFELLKLATETVPSASRLDQYLSQAKDALRKRILRQACLNALSDISDKTKTADSAQAAIESSMQQMYTMTTSTIAETAAEVAARALIESMPSSSRSVTRFVSTGIEGLDQILCGGLYHGSLSVLAARPSMGKTTLAMNIAYLAAKRGVPVLMFSLEMPNAELMKNLFSRVSGVNSYHIRKGDYEAEAGIAINSAAEAISGLPMYFCDSQSMTMRNIAAVSRKLVTRSGVRLVVIDYLQLMEGDPSANSREERVAGLSRACKRLAKDLDSPVLLLSQLNRDIESKMRKDKTPRLSDLRESGAIEQDADVVMFIHRPSYYDKEKSSDRAEVYIAKQRCGPTGMVPLQFIADCSEFREWDVMGDMGGIPNSEGY